MSYPKPEGKRPRANQRCPLCGAEPSVAHAEDCPWHLWAQDPEPTPKPILLTAEQAEHICETLIEMAVRLPMKYRNHEHSLNLLRWLERHGTTTTEHRSSPEPAPGSAGVVQDRQDRATHE